MLSVLRIVVACTLLLPMTVFAAAGDLDSSFGGDGLVTTAFGAHNYYANAVIQQADGKLVAAGVPKIDTGSGDVFALARYNSNGSLDTSFNSSGMVETIVGGQSSLALSVIQQADGKLVAAGFSYVGSNTDFALARYNSNGSLDLSFNGSGIITTDIGAHDIANAVIQQTDGKLVVAGFTKYSVGTNDEFALLRYNSDGSLDTSFNGSGKFTMAMPDSMLNRLNEVIQQADGKLVVTGVSMPDSSSPPFIVLRFNSDGSLDTSFNVNGIVTTTIGTESSFAQSVIQQIDGKLVVAGYSYDAGNRRITLVRYNSDGSLDTAFNSSGVVITTIGGDDGAMSLIQQNDGKLVVSGFAINSSIDFALVRYNSDGSLDTSFNGDGIVTTSATYYNQAHSVILQADGKLVVAGGCGHPSVNSEGTACVFALARYESVDINADTDHDTLLDVWELAHGRNPLIADYQISSGGAYNCFLGDNGVHCWGINFDGQLNVPPLVNPVMVSAGRYHSCALDATGVKCWGRDYFGETTPPVLVNPVSVSAGMMFTCALDDLGVHCWGAPFADIGTVPALVNPVQVTAGGVHACALDDNGVHCWGRNFEGQTIIPALVNPRLVSAGHVHNCVLDDTGVKCWGGGTTNTGTDPNYGQSIVPTLINPVMVSAGDYHSCAIDDSGVVCWGAGITNTGVVPRLGQSIVPPLSHPVAVSAGGSHTCALDSTGVVCWGANDFGQINVNTVVIDPDGDGVDSKYDAFPLDDAQSGDLDGDAIDNIIDTDMDGDSVLNINDNCRYVANANQLDTDADGRGNACENDPDSDNDGLTNNIDNDDDNDTVLDAGDNCQFISNTDQRDTDGGPVNDGDACDLDDDDDWIDDEVDNCPLIVNQDQIDTDSDGFGDACDITVKNDYNNDHIAGWIWKGVSNGNETKSQNWQLTFPLHSNNWAVPNRFYHPVFPDQANWDIVTTGDFNKDDDADILWRNNATAQWKVWQTQNGIRSAQNDLADFDLAHEWQVIGAGDTDKDGDDDVILNNTTSGEVRIWKMENHAIGASYNIGTKAGYTLNRIGDFNKDGDVDLLFRQNGSDVLITWELEANAFVTERALANTGAGYNPVCAGDFDKDGDDDIMLVNSSTTQEKWFVMENYTRSQKVGSTNAGFVFKGCGDYDGDGDADALWQRSSDDANRVILQQNYGSTKQTVYTNAFGGANGFVYRGNSN